MLSQNYNKLTTEEKEIVIEKIQRRTHGSEVIVKQVLKEMNPPLDFKNNRLVLHQNTLMRIQQSVAKCM